ncbi:MAG: hypothetical protein EZS26_000730 [Candidatus Ordinivivax streblomastigis]|uniref:Uncharacterized protein n=1 Tax=Candidatus Ordinivivax streblomastigis TaxID=2540710 RepID=A0A5M8P3Q1_9BACT|nr:MAG: hypothetical protein EZS26_000730 [Candidatus Ordinivivax streblomastigis]
MNENLEQEKIRMEREELNLLVQGGFQFDVSIKVRQRGKGIRGFFGKRQITEETQTFEIHEPTLSVLDRISFIALDMVINSEELNEGSEEVITKAKELVKDNSERLARLIAIAVLGEDYHITEISKSGKIKRHNDDKELNRLTDLFFHTIKPSKLVGLASAITNISNLGDFIGSMRLLSGTRTTQPRKNRIE